MSTAEPMFEPPRDGEHQPGAESGTAPGAEPATPPAEAPADASAGVAGEEQDGNRDAAATAVEVDLASLLAEHDARLDQLRRLQADFENFRKQTQKRIADEVDRASGRIVEDLLPVLDACELGYAHGVEGIEAIWSSLLNALRRHGLEPLDSLNKPFDPEEHDAVAHEEGDGEQVVVEVLRTGYRWKGRVLRPAMVKVRG